VLRQLIEVCVRRRLPALVVTAGIAAYGVNAYLSLPVEAYPDVSNVQVVEEMVNLILAQRAYEVNSKAVQAADEMMQQSNNMHR